MLENNSSFINHTFRKYLIPSILSLLGMTVISFLNSMFTGSILGQEALAAMNLIHPIFFIFAMLGCLINIGGAVCTSIAQGKNEEERAESFVTFSLAASIVIPLLVSGLGALFFKQFMGMLGARGELYSLIEGYGRIMLLGGVFTTLLYYPFNFLRINGKSQIAMIMFAVMGVADIGLALTFLHMGLGLWSMGLAVVLSTALADVTGLFCLFWGGKVKLGRIGRLTDVGLQVAKVGSAAGLNNLCNLLRTTLLNALILKEMGARGVSVFAVGCSMLNFATAFVAGCGQTVLPFIGVYYGERDYTSIRMVMKTAVRYALWIHTVLFLLCTVCSIPIAGWFGMTEPDMKRAAAGAVFWIALSLIPAAVNNVYIFYYATIRHVCLASWITFLRSFGAVAVFAWIICRAGFPQWIFCAFPAGEIFTLLFLKGYCKWLCRRKKELSGMLLINTKEEEKPHCFMIKMILPER